MATAEAAPVRACVARLRTILSMPLRVDTPEILALLERLAAAAPAAEALGEGGALATVGSRFLRCHRDARIRARSRELVEQWLGVLEAGTEGEERSPCESTSTTISTPSSAAVALSGQSATAGAAAATAGALADVDADAAPALPQAGSTAEASLDGGGHTATRTSGSGTVSAVEFLARCSATLQHRQRKAVRRQRELRRLTSEGFSPRKESPAKRKHDQRRADRNVKPAIDNTQERAGPALVMRVGAESSAAWSGGGA